MKTFDARLNSCMENGNLTLADLARWFDRPHPTVRGWACYGFSPRGGPHDVDRTYAMLDALELQIKKGGELPFKRGIGRRARIRIIKGLRRDIDNRLSKKDTAR